MASNCPSDSFRSLVCTFPRIIRIRTSGFTAFIWSSLRRLLVPTTLPGFRSPSLVPSQVTNTSAAVPRLSTAPIPSPCGNSMGMSLALCTARSISPPSSASSSSFVNIPFPPKEVRERSSSSSPLVDISTISTRTPGNACSIFSLTISV